MSQTNFTAKQLTAIARLAEGHTHTRITDEIKVSVRTVERWVKKPEFLAEVEKARAKNLESIASRCHEQIQKMVPTALNVVATTLRDPAARTSDKLRACDIVGKWAGLQQMAIAQTNQQAPEENLKDYLAYLSTKDVATNGNGSGKH